MNDSIVLKVVDWCLAGYSKIEIREMIRDNDPLLAYTNLQCDNLVLEAKNLLAEIVSVDTKQTTAIHIGRYEQIYSYFNSIGHVEGANKAMKQKERLLGLTGNSKILINKRTEITINRNVSYDVNRLSLPERLRIEALQRKIQPTIPGITQSGQIEEIAFETTQAPNN